MSWETQLEAGFRQIAAQMIKQALQMENEIQGQPPEDFIKFQSRENGPQPWPWQGRLPAVQSAVALFVSAIGLKQVAAKLSDGQGKRELTSAADQAIADWEDEYCGTRPPHPHVSLALSFELAAFANNLQEGSLRTSILQEAGQIAQKAFGSANAAKAAVARGKA